MKSIAAAALIVFAASQAAAYATAPARPATSRVYAAGEQRCQLMREEVALSRATLIRLEPGESPKEGITALRRALSDLSGLGCQDVG